MPHPSRRCTLVVGGLPLPVDGSITPGHDDWFLDAAFNVHPDLDDVATPFSTPDIAGTAAMNVIQANSEWQLAYPNSTQRTQRFWQAESCAPLDDEVTASSTSPRPFPPSEQTPSNAGRSMNLWQGI
ncbi:MAG: hypothetical protein H0X24_00175 [Ktedonobacterales bacterium]|nr:hypothetical protein [Ktedonobacterales bacterium]